MSKEHSDAWLKDELPPFTGSDLYDRTLSYRPGKEKTLIQGRPATAWTIGNTPIPKDEMSKVYWLKGDDMSIYQNSEPRFGLYASKFGQPWTAPTGWFWIKYKGEQELKWWNKKDENHWNIDTSNKKPRSAHICLDDIDKNLRELVWNCYRRGINTNVSCAGHHSSEKQLKARFKKELEMTEHILLMTSEEQMIRDSSLSLQDCHRFDLLQMHYANDIPTDTATAPGMMFTNLDLVLPQKYDEWKAKVQEDNNLGYIELHLPVIDFCCRQPSRIHPLQQLKDAAVIFPYADIELSARIQEQKSNLKQMEYYDDGNTKRAREHERIATDCGAPTHFYHPDQRNADVKYSGYYSCKIRVQAPRPKRQRATWKALSAMIDTILFEDGLINLGAGVAEQPDDKPLIMSGKKGSLYLKNYFRDKIAFNSSGDREAFNQLSKIIKNHDDNWLGRFQKMYWGDNA